MRDPARIDNILELIEKIWKKYPDLRLGQLICNCFHPDADIYFIDDDELVEKLKFIYKIKE